MSKLAVITGTSRGLGRTIAEYLLEQGWQVIGLSRDCSIQHEQYQHKYTDIKNRNEVYRALETVNAVDLIVNNSAIFSMTRFADTDDYLIDAMIDTNVKGSIWVTKALLPKLHAGSRIFFINSVAGLEELEKQSIYCSTKYALTAFAGVLGKELQERDIKVTSIHPGGINTPLWNNDNPYPCGDVDGAIPPIEIAKLINFIYNSHTSVEYKTVKLFPTSEWH
jgi:NADP-dependent 3-hydroxy acid dehydrogenase YdfG